MQGFNQVSEEEFMMRVVMESFLFIAQEETDEGTNYLDAITEEVLGKVDKNGTYWVLQGVNCEASI